MNDNTLYYGLCIIGLFLIIRAFFLITEDCDNE